MPLRLLKQGAPLHDLRSLRTFILGAAVGYALRSLYGDAAATSTTCRCECAPCPADYAGRLGAQHGQPDAIERLIGNTTPSLGGAAPLYTNAMHGDDEHAAKQLGEAALPTGPVHTHSEDESAHRGEDTVARVLSRRVRVLCFVITTQANLHTRARHVKNTWARHCNKMLFVSDRVDPDFPTIDVLPEIDVETSKIHIWAKIKAAFKLIHEQYRDDYDWFVRADDDAYWVIENLRYMLAAHSTEEPIWFGCRFKPFTPVGYMSGGVGYALSREALRRLVTIAIPDTTICAGNDTWAEDAEIAKCLYNVGVAPADSRDSEARHRFLPDAAHSHIMEAPVDPTYWLWRYMYYPLATGMDCCSDLAVGFHYTNPLHMYLMEYSVYHLRPFGVNTQLVTESGRPVASGSLSDDQIMEAVARQAWGNRGPGEVRVDRDRPDRVDKPVPPGG